MFSVALAAQPRSLLRRATTTASQALTEALVARRLRASTSPPPFTLAGVYSARNAAIVRALIQDVPHVRLWALDEPAAELADLTVGSGPGARMDHLNRLVEGVSTPYVVITDDDVSYAKGDIWRLVTIAERCKLDICQPAQAPEGYPSHTVTVRHRFSAYRLTNFVEVGPVTVFGPRMRGVAVPFPPGSGQGWGLDVEWAKLIESHGARLAVVDAVTIMHLAPPGLAYARQAEEVRLNAILEAAGVDSEAGIWSFPKTLSYVRPWKL
jgi:hypothetical protein